MKRGGNTLTTGNSASAPATLRQSSARTCRRRSAVIDSKHANPLGCWEAQGKPEYPTKAQLAELELASQLVWENIPAEAGRNVLKLKLEPESAAIVKAVLA